VLIGDRKGRHMSPLRSKPPRAMHRAANSRSSKRCCGQVEPAIFRNLFTGVSISDIGSQRRGSGVRDGEVIYDLCFGPPISIFKDLVESSGPTAVDGIPTPPKHRFARVADTRVKTFGKRALAVRLYEETLPRARGGPLVVSLDAFPCLSHLYTCPPLSASARAGRRRRSPGNALKSRRYRRNIATTSRSAASAAGPA